MMDYEAAIASRGAEMGAHMEVDVVGSDESRDDTDLDPGTLNVAQSPNSDDSDDDEENDEHSEIIVFRIKEEYDGDKTRGCSEEDCNCDLDNVKENLTEFCQALIKFRNCRSKMCPKTVKDYLCDNRLFGICFRWLELGNFDEDDDGDVGGNENKDNDPPGDISSSGVLVTNVRREDLNLDEVSSEEEESMSSVDEPPVAAAESGVPGSALASLPSEQAQQESKTRPTSLSILLAKKDISKSCSFDRISSSSSLSQVSSPGTPCRDENPTDETMKESQRQASTTTETETSSNANNVPPTRPDKLAVMLVNQRALTKIGTEHEPEEAISEEDNETETHQPQTQAEDTNDDALNASENDSSSSKPGETLIAKEVDEDITLTPTPSEPIPMPSTSVSETIPEPLEESQKALGNAEDQEPSRSVMNDFAEPLQTPVRKSAPAALTSNSSVSVLQFRCSSPSTSVCSMASTALVIDEESRPLIFHDSPTNQLKVVEQDKDKVSESGNAVCITSSALESSGRGQSVGPGSGSGESQIEQEEESAGSLVINSVFSYSHPSTTTANEASQPLEAPGTSTIGKEIITSSEVLSNESTPEILSTNTSSVNAEKESQNISESTSTSINNKLVLNSCTKKQGELESKSDNNGPPRRFSREDGEISDDEASESETLSCSYSDASTLIVESLPRSRQNQKRKLSNSSNNSSVDIVRNSKRNKNMPSSPGTSSSETCTRRTRSSNSRSLRKRFAALEANTRIRSHLGSFSSGSDVSNQRKGSNTPERETPSSKRPRRSCVAEASSTDEHASRSRSRSGSRHSSRSSNSSPIPSTEKRNNSGPASKRKFCARGESEKGLDRMAVPGPSQSQKANSTTPIVKQSSTPTAPAQLQNRRGSDNIPEIILSESDEEDEGGPSYSVNRPTAKIRPRKVAVGTKPGSSTSLENMLKSMPANRKTSGYTSDDSVSSINSNVPLALRLARRLTKKSRQHVLNSKVNSPRKPEQSCQSPQLKHKEPHHSQNKPRDPPIHANDDDIEIIAEMPPPPAPRRKSGPPPCPPPPKRECRTGSATPSPPVTPQSSSNKPASSDQGIRISFDAAKTNPIKTTPPPSNSRPVLQKSTASNSKPSLPEKNASTIVELEAEDESRRVLSPNKTQQPTKVLPSVAAARPGSKGLHNVPKKTSASTSVASQKESSKSLPSGSGEKRRPATPPRIAATVAAQAIRTAAATSPSKARKDLTFDPRQEAKKISREAPQTNVKLVAEKLQRQNSGSPNKPSNSSSSNKERQVSQGPPLVETPAVKSSQNVNENSGTGTGSSFTRDPATEKNLRRDRRVMADGNVRYMSVQSSSPPPCPSTTESASTSSIPVKTAQTPAEKVQSNPPENQGQGSNAPTSSSSASAPQQPCKSAGSNSSASETNDNRQAENKGPNTATSSASGNAQQQPQPSPNKSTGDNSNVSKDNGNRQAPQDSHRKPWHPGPSQQASRQNPPSYPHAVPLMSLPVDPPVPIAVVIPSAERNRQFPPGSPRGRGGNSFRGGNPHPQNPNTNFQNRNSYYLQGGRARRGNNKGNGYRGGFNNPGYM